MCKIIIPVQCQFGVKAFDFVLWSNTRAECMSDLVFHSFLHPQCNPCSIIWFDASIPFLCSMYNPSTNSVPSLQTRTISFYNQPPSTNKASTCDPLPASTHKIHSCCANHCLFPPTLDTPIHLHKISVIFLRSHRLMNRSLLVAYFCQYWKYE